MRKALVAMSGGVDSSVAAWLMKEQGRDSAGATMKLIADNSRGAASRASKAEEDAGRRCSPSGISDAEKVARLLGISHYVFDFTEEFAAEVIGRFVKTYERGMTPNPCVDCNRYIKFALLLARARELDRDVLVTGHYARIEKDGGTGRFLLKKALDAKKDQSYFLYRLGQEELSRAVFPLGEKTKEEVREIASAAGFVNAQKEDSQDICFVPDGDYGAFIENYTGRNSPEGDYVDTEGRVLGRHRGIIRYTIGQRRGLALAFSTPVYVKAINPENNTVVIGGDETLYSKSLVVTDINFIPFDKLESSRRFKVKTRYRQSEQDALIHQTGDDTLLVEFDRPQRALTPGQALVIYDGDFVAGGGTISGTGVSR